MGAPINRLESLWPLGDTREPSVIEEPPLSRRMKRRARSMERGARGLMAEHPTAAIVAAAAFGIALGWIVKRK